jgi:hypothetical protein
MPRTLLETGFGILATLAIAFTSLGSPSYASTLFDVQFGCTAGSACQINANASDTNTQQQTGAAVIGSAGDFWNLVSGDGGLGATGTDVPLLDTNGLATAATVSWTSSAEFTRGLPQDPVAFDSTPYENLMSGYLAEGGTGSITISGLVAGGDYDLYLYTQGDVNATGRQTTFTVNGGSPVTTSPGSASADTFISGQNYVLFDVAANAGGDISVVYSNFAGEADVNGFQLAAVPEPSAVILVLTGLLAVACFARKRIAQAL